MPTIIVASISSIQASTPILAWRRSLEVAGRPFFGRRKW
jgi:hypothetical protein